jgi:cardiolipin synthase
VNRSLAPAPAPSRLSRLRARLTRNRDPDVFEAMVAGNRVALLHDGDECFPSMLDFIRAAQHEVLLEMYWFDSSPTGRRFADALSERARAGATVCVIYDAVGSIEADEEMFDEMRAAGCQVEQYNPVAPWRRRFRLARIQHRDHRKILVVDGAVGFTGGVNIGHPWACHQDGGLGWRDDMIRIEGPAAGQLRSVFLDTWRRLGGKEPPAPSVAPGPPSLTGRGPPPEEGFDSPVRVLANRWVGERRAIRKAYLDQIAKARDHVYITNSYFLPDRSVRNALARAAKRGVDVRILVPNESDVFAVYYATRNLYTRLIRQGIQVFEWVGTVLHAKTAVVDGVWCTVGTFNLDYRSWRFNLEVNVAVEDRRVAGAMRERFILDLEKSKKIELSTWRFRPLSERVLEWFFYLFRKLL